jgi:endonuclease/exonuclease/phosphatase (EEP) superfamily protein YafD
MKDDATRAKEHALVGTRRSSRLRRMLLPDWQERKRLLRRDAWTLVITAYVLLVLAYAWPQDFRSESQGYNLACYGLFMIRTFLWHIGLVALLVGVAAAWRKAWPIAAAALPLIVVTLAPELVHFLPKRPATVQGQPITVMSVNLLYCNLRTGPIIEEIRTADPDVLLLQEYTSDWHRAMQETIGGRYPHIAYVTRDNPFGAAIYSRRPFIGQIETRLSLGNVGTPQMRAVVEVDGRQVAIYNIHLQPPYGLMRTRLTRHQLADLRDLLAKESLPAIVSGDFNFTDRSPNAGLLREAGLVDTHEAVGWGRGSTWPVDSFFRYMPGIRLDHIYVSDQIACTRSYTGIGSGSDHRPVIATLGWSGR